jgi:hypothetical protein
MSYNGSGTFNINSAGTPYVNGTVISSTAANALNNDLATGLSTAITKDGQTTPTANIPLGGFKITGLGAGTVASDAARLSQVQNSTTTTLISITGTDTLTGTVSPTLTAYATGQVFSFIVAATNTGAVTLNVDSIGVKAVTRTGSVALVAGDLVTGQVAVVEYDGTRFQLLNGNSFTNLKVSGTLGVTGITTVAAGSEAAPSIVSTTGTADTGQFFPAADTVAWSTAGSERVRITSGGLVGIGTTAPTNGKLNVSSSVGSAYGTNTSTVSLESTDTAGVDIGPAISFMGSSGNLTTPYGFGAIAGIKESTAVENYGGNLAFYTQNTGGSATYTEAMRINSASNVTLQKNISVGAATPTTSGTGITFPSIQSASTNTNTLDDYEEGTFTPALTFGGAAVGLTYTTQLGKYVKIGGYVWFFINIVVNDNGSSSGSALITGLPYTVANDNLSSPSVIFLNGLSGISVGWSGLVSANTTTHNLFYGGGAGSVTAMTEANIVNSANIRVFGGYGV